MTPKGHRGLINAYRSAGEGFLAMKLQRVFKEINTDEDRILHNDIVKEIELLIDDNAPALLGLMASDILKGLFWPQKRAKWKAFLSATASNILMLCKYKDDQNVKKEK